MNQSIEFVAEQERRPRLGGIEPWVRALSLVFFFAVWHVAALLIADRMLPTPVRVGGKIWEYLADGSMVFHIAVTLARVSASFVVAMLIGTILGMLMGWSARADRAFDGWLVIALNIPALVVIILCYVWFGLTETAVVLAVAINKIPNVVVTLREGARDIQPELLHVARAFRLPWHKTLFKVYLPQLYPYLMVATRSGIALIWKIVLVAELLGRSNGVGFQLSVYFQFFDIASLLAYTFAFTGVVMCVEVAVLRPLERRLTGWRL